MSIIKDESVFKKGHPGLKVYSANPWFNSEQMERSEFMRTTLEKHGFNVYDPKSECKISLDSDESVLKQAFDGNIMAIAQADFILAVTDGKDMGVCFEVGSAYTRNIPIVYFAETLGNGKFNLMLAQSGIHVITSREQLEADLKDPEFIRCIKENRRFSKYQGYCE